MLALGAECHNYLTEPFNNYSPSPRASFPASSPGLLVSEREAVHDSLASLNVGRAIKPDVLPNKVLKKFAPKFPSSIMSIYNRLLEEGYVPDLL